MAEEAREPYHLKVKIGNDEFDASGSQEVVRDLYGLFLEARRSAPAALPPATGDKPKDVKDNDDESVSQDKIDRVFVVRNDVISLRTLPETDNSAADALLMLIWAHLVMRNEQHVSALDLMSSARLSGLQIDRIDRVISARQQMFQRGGAKRGTRYSLNNAGISHARRLVLGMCQ